MNVHTMLDFYRIMGILEEYIKKLKFLDSLKTKMTSDINMIQGEEMKRLLKEQGELEKRYAELLEQAEKLKGLAEKSKLQEVKREIDEHEKKIKENTKNMWKILKDNPDVNENRDKIEKNKKDLGVLLEKAYDGLQNDNLDEYKKTVEEEKSKLERLDKLKVEEKELTKIIKETIEEYTIQSRDTAAEVFVQLLFILGGETKERNKGLETTAKQRTVRESAQNSLCKKANGRTSCM